MTAEVAMPDRVKMEDAADGPHEERTVQRLLLDIYSYVRNWCKAWANRVDRRDRDNGHGI